MSIVVSMMHQQAATSHYNSAQGGSQHYQGQSSIAMMSQSNQGNSMMGQRPMGPYRASQQGKICYRIIDRTLIRLVILSLSCGVHKSIKFPSHIYKQRIPPRSTGNPEWWKCDNEMNLNLFSRFIYLIISGV